MGLSDVGKWTHNYPISDEYQTHLRKVWTLPLEQTCQDDYNNTPQPTRELQVRLLFTAV